MAISGLNKYETEDFISESDPCKTEKDGATIFQIGALDVDARALLQDSAIKFESDESGKVSYQMAPAAHALMACRLGLRGWRNFKDEKGNDIVFTTVTKVINGKAFTVPSDDTLASVPAKLLAEIGKRVFERNSLGAEQVKN